MIAFSWNGLPQYAARLLAAAIRDLGRPALVVGSHPKVPVGGMEAVLGQAIHWVDETKPATWASMGLPVPRVFFQSGWAYPAFNALGEEVREAGGRVCLLMDNAWRGNLRQAAGALWFRAYWRDKFGAVLVPGRSGRRLASWYGMPQDRIWEGMYGADPALFFNGSSLSARPRRILFVGQFVPRKGCVQLAEAFADVADRLPGWELSMYGGGPLRDRLRVHAQISVHDFVQPEGLGACYRNSRVLALPSLHEAWGLVVHEAALSGCQLLLSSAVGSRHDFADERNSEIFVAGKMQSLKSALVKIASRTECQSEEGQAISLRLSSTHGPAVFSARVQAIVKCFEL